ncbi:MAG: glycosyltransferase [Aquincola sp.]|nr:glycosyltransferase [Aquincola sp.]
MCMISYKHEPYIAQAIESILSQKVDFPIELVIGDDCSPDGTTAVIQHWAERDLRVKVLPCERNLGVMTNFSRTLEACRGTYVAVCEGDDYWTDPYKLASRWLSWMPIPTTPLPRINRRSSGTSVRCDFFESTYRQPSARKICSAADCFTRRRSCSANRWWTCSPPRPRSCRAIGCSTSACRSPARCITARSACAPTACTGDGMSSNVRVDQLRLDLDAIAYLRRLRPDFPARRYRSYVYLTIGLCRKATLPQRAGYLMLAFVYSFAFFPRNIAFITSRLARALASRLRAAPYTP